MSTTIRLHRAPLGYWVDVNGSRYDIYRETDGTLSSAVIWSIRNPMNEEVADFTTLAEVRLWAADMMDNGGRRDTT